MNVAVSVRDLQFSYSGSDRVIDIAELSVNVGEKIFLYGPSGCGKTTLLSLLAGVLTAQKGRVEILGNDLTALSQRERDRFRGSHIGYIFQQFNLLPYLNGLENVLLPCKLSSARTARLDGVSMRDKAVSLAEKLGVNTDLKKKPAELSVGQQQRIAATRALLGRPELIIADEPTSALDFDHRERFLNLLLQESEIGQSTVLFVSHDRSLARLFDRTISLPDINHARQTRD